MQVKFLKNHLKHKAGDVAIKTDAEANYLQRMGVVSIHKEEKPKVEVAQKVIKKSAPKKKAKKK